jgi:hypothetical protein
MVLPLWFYSVHGRTRAAVEDPDELPLQPTKPPAPVRKAPYYSQIDAYSRWTAATADETARARTNVA